MFYLQCLTLRIRQQAPYLCNSNNKWWCSPEFACSQKRLLVKKLKLLYLVQVCMSILGNHFSKSMSIFLVNTSYTYSSMLFLQIFSYCNVTANLKAYHGYLLPNSIICEMRNFIPVMKEKTFNLLQWEIKSLNTIRRKKDIVVPVFIVQKQLDKGIICRNVW